MHLLQAHNIVLNIHVGQTTKIKLPNFPQDQKIVLFTYLFQCIARFIFSDMACTFVTENI